MIVDNAADHVASSKKEGKCNNNDSRPEASCVAEHDI